MKLFYGLISAEKLLGREVRSWKKETKLTDAIFFWTIGRRKRMQKSSSPCTAKQGNSFAEDSYARREIGQVAHLERLFYVAETLTSKLYRLLLHQ